MFSATVASLRPVLGRSLLSYATGTLNRFFYGSNVDLDEDISVRALLERLAEETQLPANCLELRGGFPPRELEIPSDGSIAAKEAFEIQHNDLVTVQKKSEVALVSGGNLGEASNKDAGVHVNVESFPAPSTVRQFHYGVFMLSAQQVTFASRMLSSVSTLTCEHVCYVGTMKRNGMTNKWMCAGWRRRFGPSNSCISRRRSGFAVN